MYKQRPLKITIHIHYFIYNKNTLSKMDETNSDFSILYFIPYTMIQCNISSILRHVPISTVKKIRKLHVTLLEKY